MKAHTSTDGCKFHPGDKVCYSKGHHEYLRDIALWPSSHIPRTALTGTVTDSTATTVTVEWAHTSVQVKHFPSNLELLVSHSYNPEDEVFR